MSRFHNWNAEMDAASPRIAAIRAAARGEAPPRSAAAVSAKPATASLASSPVPAQPKASAPAKTSYVAQPLTPRLKAIRDEVLAEMAQEAKQRRQAAIHQQIRAERANTRKG